MFKTFFNALKVKDIRKKLLFTFWIMIIVRIGCQIPAPGIDSAAVQTFLTSTLGDSFSFLNSITGGSFSNMSIFALNVTPYITSSIIMQLLTIAIPALEEMHKDGEDGRKKIQKITRYLTVALAMLEATGLVIGFSREGLLTSNSFFTCFVIVVVLAAGACAVMWLGERISERGIGNGISIVLLINIVSRMPSDMSNLYVQFVQGKEIVKAVAATLIIIFVIVVTTMLVIVLQGAERKIPVQYAKKTQGRRMVGGQATYIPIKVNTANVIPIIFAGSLLSVPSIIVNLFNIQTNDFWSKVLIGMNQNYWFNPSYPYAYIGLVVYLLLVIMFAYFYTSITFNPMEIANNMKKSGGFIPGIRPGKPTQDYLNKILNYVVFIGVCGLIIIAVIPMFFNGRFGANVSFGGTSLIIIAGVIIETVKQIESMMLVRHYSGFLND